MTDAVRIDQGRIRSASRGLISICLRRERGRQPAVARRLVAAFVSAGIVGLLTAGFSGIAAADTSDPAHLPDRSEYRAPFAQVAPVIDGIADDAAWRAAVWHEIDHTWLGPDFSDSDFQGRYRVVWTAERVYVLAEIVDDVLFDGHRDPLVQYWDDDCLEIFIDEDYSGGDHQYNHNAFAYHVSLDNQAIDIGTDRTAHAYNGHVESRWRQHEGRIVWELAIEVYSDSYVDESDQNEPVVLTGGKIMGLMIAYCDNDGSDLRENFVGSESVPYGKKDRGWIDAGLFGKLILDDSA